MFTALFLLNVVKGLRMPSQWAMTHYLFTYRFGFMKRSLWGELLRRTLGGWTASYFCLAAVGRRKREPGLLALVQVFLRLIRLPTLTLSAGSSHRIGDKNYDWDEDDSETAQFHNGSC